MTSMYCKEEEENVEMYLDEAGELLYRAGKP